MGSHDLNTVKKSNFEKPPKGLNFRQVTLNMKRFNASSSTWIMTLALIGQDA